MLESSCTSQMDPDSRHGVAFYTEGGHYAVINVPYWQNHHYYCTPGDYIVCTCMHAVKKGRRLESKKLFQLKSKGYMDGIKRR